MKAWKVWTITGIAILVITVVAGVSALWNNVSSEWNVETNAAQFALDHSPINHIENHDVFTASGAQEVFFGDDVFGRKWYAFVEGSPFVVHSAPADGFISADKAKHVASMHGVDVKSVHIGWLDGDVQTLLHTKVNVAYEVIGTDRKGQPVHLYIDANNGAVILSIPM